MSKIILESNDTGTGSVTLRSPLTNSDRVLTLPDIVGDILTDSSDLEPQVKTAVNASGTAPIYACRAWVNFNGTGTVAIRASGNVSSITDNGVGNYTVNFATAMPDVDFSLIATVKIDSTNLLYSQVTTTEGRFTDSRTVDYVKVQSSGESSGSFTSPMDVEIFSVAIVR